MSITIRYYGSGCVVTHPTRHWSPLKSLKSPYIALKNWWTISSPSGCSGLVQKLANQQTSVRALLRFAALSALILLSWGKQNRKSSAQHFLLGSVLLVSVTSRRPTGHHSTILRSKPRVSRLAQLVQPWRTRSLERDTYSVSYQDKNNNITMISWKPNGKISLILVLFLGIEDSCLFFEVIRSSIINVYEHVIEFYKIKISTLR